MGDRVAVAVDWFGAYSLAEAQEAAKDFQGWSLYMLIGKAKSQKAAAKLQYIGASNKISERLKNHHRAIDCLSQECSVWLGEIASSGIPGMKLKSIDRRVDLAEWAHAYFLDLPLNTKKRKRPPDGPVTVLNRWWLPDYKTPSKRRPHRDWPDIIEFIGSQHVSSICWVRRVMIDDR